ncbi:TonB-dependent receptor [Novosphingobium mangrovi (ex Hu et al. 2023)]|uniref:TonB-dependent receptor n=1 Tax=Novosphingobium mangrovi (ex Hu et al. 2023) TaxID=2930094 RepID=A0ABT0AFG0_9SPHN|nr:TonB-dependent receptor [Novosphingobium mangrovi (ex Hu et al. 2023)]MCJ1961916.1 TonB-dependent receptor [Novosphingobium mangrovi (ex Hu et al. 2023)]
MNRTANTMRLASTLSTLAVAGSLLYAAPAFAQEAAPASVPGEIVVTARKTGEDILKTPVTVDAVTSEELDVRGIVSMNDVAAASPGININNSSSGHADRSFQQVVLRGFTPSTTLATTVSSFIDGVPVSSPSQINNVSSPARVEILKGPQSAYFGRNTFAGAVNVVTQTPDGYWGGEMMGMIGTRDNWRLRGAVEGPIIEDLIAFRVTGEKYSKGGSYENQNGVTLGDQSSVIGTATLSITPSADVSIKLFGMMSEDKDGPAAQTRLYAYDVFDADGNQVLQGQANGVTDAGNPWFFGTVPSIANPVTANVQNTNQIRQFLAIDTNRVVDANDGVQGYGLRRKTTHFHGTADWDIVDGVTATVLGGYNKETWSTMIDLDGYDTSSLGFDFPYLIERKVEDWSIEGRLAYETDRFQGLVGVSYLQSDLYQGLGGGFNLTESGLNPGGKSRSKTVGMFFGATYELTDTVSISAEGRYQIDRLEAYADEDGVTIVGDGNGYNPYLTPGYYGPNSLLANSKYKNFTPRIIVDWDVTPDMMVYASWAKGVNPAQFNTAILNNTYAIQLAASEAGGELAIEPEKVTNYEVGLKGRNLDGSFRYQFAAYYAQWRNQINTVQIVVPDETESTGYSFVNTAANSGSADLYGLEGNVTWRPLDFLTIDAAGAYNESDIKDFTSPTVTALTGITDFNGNDLKNTSKYSANVGVTFAGDIAEWDNGSWFVRGDWNFKSGVYSNEANLAKLPDLHLFNARAGVTHGNISVDVFVNNIFNNHTPVSVSDNYTFTPNFAYTGTFSALMLGLNDLRTAGLQASIKF